MTQHFKRWQDNTTACQLFYYICFGHEALSKTFIRFIKSKYDIFPNQMAVLGYLRSDDKLTMGDISHRLNISKQQTTQLINAMEKKELVERRYEESNRRIVYVAISDKGDQILQEGEDLYLDHALNELDKLSQSDNDELLKSFDSLCRILAQVNFNVTIPDTQKDKLV